ncbi:MAG: hypothetical protein V4649_10945 [Bacteroidota bacterium]
MQDALFLQQFNVMVTKVLGTAVAVVFMCCIATAGNGQTFLRSARDSVRAKYNRLPPADSLLSRGKRSLRRQERVVTEERPAAPAATDTAARKPIDAVILPLRTGWADGRVWEFSNAYTIRKNEWRLNLLGPSSFGITDKLEVKSYLLAVVTPNVSFKYRFLDRKPFSAALEAGGAAGGLPVAAAAGIILKGGGIAGGTAGIITFTDVFMKVYAGWQPTHNLTLSVRAGISHIRASYKGFGGFAAIGGNGGAIGFFPFSANLIRANWAMAGFEADYVLNARNAIVLRSSVGRLYTTRIADLKTDTSSADYLAFPSISWNHGWKHLHLSAGVYAIIDPPSFDLVRRSELPVSPFVNVYWVLNNGRRWH